MDPSDREYVERSRDGHPDDFSYLVERHQGSVFAYLTGLLRNRTLAEDAAQESFVRAFIGLPKLRKPESFRAWLLGIAGRVAKEYFRSRAARSADQPVEDVPADPEVPQADCRLEEAVAALPENYREVILLRYYEDLSCQEVSQRLDMPLGTVTKMLSRAYAMLRQQLQSKQKSEATLPLEN